ncbi:MAG: sugar ABC transporter ATP-binding protein [Phycisphaerales bacterium]|nr:MAG: sugar ABC transporter ATP-binding protein [Phycisphaerales bacterium]
MSEPRDSAAVRLRMEGVRKAFGATVALAGVDLEVQAGEVHALIGENGAGKSTLMKILSGAYRADEGLMWLDGEPYQPKSPADGRRAGVAMIYQELSLARHLSVMENILLGVEPRTGPFINWKRMRSSTSEALGQIGRGDIAPEVQVSKLSVAEQQLVEIARSVAIGCRVLVFDEPTSSLTQADIRRLFDLIRRLKADGHAIVYISHVLEEVQEIADRFTVLRDGHSVGSGRPAEVKTSEIVTMMVGRDVEELYPRSQRPAGELALKITDLAGARLPLTATLELQRGEVLGIAGLVGAGRTELMRAVFGLDPVRDGEVKVGGFVGGASPTRRWSQGVGMVSEDRKNEGLARNLTVADNITMPSMRGMGPGWLVTPAGQDRASRPWIDRLRIRCLSPRQPVEALSGGNQQKVALARLLYADVDVLLLDEPTRGIDVGSKADIYQLIDELARGDEESNRPPRAVLMISSYLPELLGVCDRIAVMRRGVLGEARPVKELDERGIMLEATGAEQAT